MTNYEVRVIGDFSTSHTEPIEVGAEGVGDQTNCPVFDMKSLDPHFLEQFSKLAWASSRLWTHVGDGSEDYREIAESFVSKKLGSEWMLAADAGLSRWTPEGWVFGAATVAGATFGLTMEGSPSGSPYLSFQHAASGKEFNLRFHVAVNEV